MATKDNLLHGQNRELLMPTKKMWAFVRTVFAWFIQIMAQPDCTSITNAQQLPRLKNSSNLTFTWRLHLRLKTIFFLLSTIPNIFLATLIDWNSLKSSARIVSLSQAESLTLKTKTEHKPTPQTKVPWLDELHVTETHTQNQLKT